MTKYMPIIFFVFITGCANHFAVMDTKFGLHRYEGKWSDRAKDFLFIKEDKILTLYCSKHSQWENIEPRQVHTNGQTRWNYKITKKEKE